MKEIATTSLRTLMEDDERPIFETDIDWVAEIEEADEQVAHDASERVIWKETQAEIDHLWRTR
jgi:hypothetical protein